MSLTLALSLCVQIAALLVVLVPLGRRAFSLVGPVFVIVAVVYHGLTEVIQAVSPVPNRYRIYVGHTVIDDWMWIVSIAILLFAVGYMVTLGRVSVSRPDSGRLKLVSWRVMAILIVPIYLVSISGRASGSYWLGGLSSQFLILAVVLASCGFIWAHDGRYLVPILIGQSLLLSQLGSRLTVIAGAILVMWALAYLGTPPSRRQVLIIVSAVLLLAFAISSARTIEGNVSTGPGRFGQGSATSARERASLVTRGLEGLQTSFRSQAFWTDWVYRFDGNTFPALIGQQYRETGATPAGTGRLAQTALLAVPRFVDPSKLDQDVTLRAEKAYMDYRYGLPTRADFLSTTLGMLYAYEGMLGLFFAALLLGVTFALLDRWLAARLTLARLVIGLGVLLCVLLYEQGVEVYPVVLRGAIALVILLKVLELARSLVPRTIARAPVAGS